MKETDQINFTVHVRIEQYLYSAYPHSSATNPITCPALSRKLDLIHVFNLRTEYKFAINTRDVTIC